MKKYCVFCLLVLLVSCINDTKDKLVSEEQIIVEIPYGEISEAEAKSLLNNFVESITGKTRGETLKVTNVTKSYYGANVNTNVRSMSSNKGVCVYEIDIENNGEEGYSLVLGDQRSPKVLVYVPHGQLSDTIYNKSLAKYIKTIPNRVADINDSKIVIDYDGKNGLPTLHPMFEATYNITTFKDTMIFIGIGYARYKDVKIAVSNGEKVPSMLPTKWNQGYPYNIHIPYECPGGDKAPAGCVTIAVSQIMAYNRKPSTYDWDTMLEIPSLYSGASNDAIEKVSTLIRNVADQLNPIYGCDGTASNIDKAMNAFRHFGYSYDDPISLNDIPLPEYNERYEKMLTSLRNHHPIYMQGANLDRNVAHAWVVDGFQTQNLNWTGVMGLYTTDGKFLMDIPIKEYEETKYFYSINWGWGGSSDGYFYLHHQDFLDGYYAAQCKILTNIY